MRHKCSKCGADVRCRLADQTTSLHAENAALKAIVDKLRDEGEDFSTSVASALGWDCRGILWVTIIRALREESQRAGRYETLLDELEAAKAAADLSRAKPSEPAKEIDNA